VIGHPFLSFTDAGGVAPTPTPVIPAAGHAGRHRRRRLIIDEVIYEGTEEQLEAKLIEILQQRIEPPKKKPAKRAKKRVVQLTAEIPEFVMPRFNMPRYEQLVRDSQDAFLTAALHRLYQRHLDDEDDNEVLLLLH
jgi:hypothetical protein